MEKIGATIAKYRKAAKLSQGELASKLNVLGFYPSVASISSWEKDVSVPNALQFLALCSTLKIDDIYGEFFNCDEGRADALKGLNEEGRKRAKEYISLLLLSEEYRENEASETKSHITDITGSSRAVKTEKSSEPVAGDPEKRAVEPQIIKTRILRLYNLPASAGTGEFLDGEDYTEVEVGNEVSAAADFGIRIKGNSMEPKYEDGQTVWIKKCENLQDGEIGIFFLNGNAYCKKLRKDTKGVSLVSLNPDYKPITITDGDELAIFGKVLN